MSISMLFEHANITTSSNGQVLYFFGMVPELLDYHHNMSSD